MLLSGGEWSPCQASKGRFGVAGNRESRRSRIGVRVGLGLVLMVGLLSAPIGALGGPAGASSPKPVPPTVTGFVATPESLSDAGGPVTLAAQVTNATSCVFSSTESVPGLPVTIPCTSGPVSTSVTLPGDTSFKAAKYTFELAVTGSKTVNAKVKFIVAGTPLPTVSSFVATPASLSDDGGTVTLSAQVTTAVSCVFSSTPALAGLPATVPCSSGPVSKSVAVPSNASTKTATYKFTLSAVGSKTAKATPVTVTAGPAPVAPVLTSISPSSGTQAGGTTVTVTGKNLTGATAVTFGAVPGTHVTPVSATEVTVVSPAGTGPVNVSVTTPGGTSTPTSKDTFTYLPGSPTPTVTGVSPSSGSTAGGTTVTITGTNLAGATAVKFGTKAGTVTADSASSITVTNPTGSVGNVDVTVTTSNGTSAISPADKFAYTSVITPCAGNITSNSEITAGTYIVDCTVDVPAGVTLAIDPGAVLKFDSGDALTVEGTLDAVGTPSSPIVFTSINDNTIGGDTGTGSPAAGDWSGISPSGVASIDVEHSILSYATVGIEAIDGVQGSVVLRSNTFDHYSESAILSFGPLSGVIADNQAATSGSSSAAYLLESSSLEFDGVYGNAASGSGQNVMEIDGTVGADTTMVAQPVPWGITESNLYVPSGITLTIGQGSVIKSSGSVGCNGGNTPGSICVDGTLNAVGTPSSPIVFTSINDNTIGGDTGTGSPAAGDWSGISPSGVASIDVEHSILSYATVGIEAIDGVQGSVVLRSNTFDHYSESAILSFGPLSGVIADNQAATSGSSSAAYLLESSSLEFDGVYGNAASGSGQNVMEIDGTVGADTTMVAQPVPWGITESNLYVPSGITLTIGQGSSHQIVGKCWLQWWEHPRVDLCGWHAQRRGHPIQPHCVHLDKRQHHRR